MLICWEVLPELIYNFLDTYQALFVGCLGFIGVILTICFNAKTQRDLQSQQRKHDIKSIRIALLTELRINAQTYEERVRDFSTSNDSRCALIQNAVMSKIYQSLLPQIGLLSLEEIEIVHQTYLLLEEMPYRLQLLVGTDNTKSNVIIIDASSQRKASEIHTIFLSSIHNAVRVLEEHM